MAAAQGQGPRLETERLVIAPYAAEDFEDVLGVWSDPVVTRYIGGTPRTSEQVWAQVLRSIGHWQVFGYGFWTLRERSSGAFVGEIGFGDHRRLIEPPFDGAPEMGWVVAPRQHGRGFATEAAEAVLAWADEHLPARTVCMIDPFNAPSLKLAARLGYRQYAETIYHDEAVMLFERHAPRRQEALVEADAATARRLVADAFPDWAGLPLTAVASAGTDNTLYRLGRDLVLRLPRRASAASQALREHRWLPMLAPHLPLEIPVPVALGGPTAGYPWSWTVCRWLEGQDAVAAGLGDNVAAASALGGFLSALRGIEAADGPPAGRQNHDRGVPLARLDARVRRDVAFLGAEIEAAAVLAIWEDALAAPVWDVAPGWVHGDIHPGNLLVRDGRLTAVLDFGLMGVGDPACDLSVAWSVFDGSARSAFRKAAGLDDAAWRRGRGWAVYNSVIALAYYVRTNPTLCAMSRRTLAELQT